MTDMRGKPDPKVVVRPRASDSQFRPSLQQWDTQGIEAQSEQQPPIGDLPEEDTYPHRDQHFIAACLGHGTEKGGEKRTLSHLQSMVHRLIPGQKVLTGRGQSNAEEQAEIEESHNKVTLHIVRDGGPYSLFSNQRNPGNGCGG